MASHWLSPIKIGFSYTTSISSWRHAVEQRVGCQHAQSTLIIYIYIFAPSSQHTTHALFFSICLFFLPRAGTSSRVFSCSRKPSKQKRVWKKNKIERIAILCLQTIFFYRFVLSNEKRKEWRIFNSVCRLNQFAKSLSLKGKMFLFSMQRIVLFPFFVVILRWQQMHTLI